MGVEVEGYSLALHLMQQSLSAEAPVSVQGVAGHLPFGHLTWLLPDLREHLFLLPPLPEQSSRQAN